MDELWQRYRTFWRPVLLGLGVFLIGLIVVHILTPDPEEAAASAAAASARVQALVQPRDRVALDLRVNAEALSESVKRLASVLDPSTIVGGKDAIETSVGQALQAAFGRGGGGAAAFDGDAAAAAQAAREVERLTALRSAFFRTGSPNVAFSALSSDVWGELRTRANRADMDLEADELGFRSVTSIARSELERRLSNLALVARVVDVAIRNGARSLDSVTFEDPPLQASDAFLQEWPVKLAITAPAPCVEALLDLLTDPRAPLPVRTLVARQPAKGRVAQGLVELTLTVDSVAVKPASSLHLDTQESRP